MAAWVKKFKTKLTINNIKAIMEEIYVDDMRYPVKKMEIGARYDTVTGMVTYKDTKIQEDINNQKNKRKRD